MKSSDFLQTPDWLFRLPDEIVRTIRLTKLAIKTKPDSELQDASTFSATVTTNAAAFQWQKNIPNKKLLRSVPYVLPVLPKFSGHRTTNGSINDQNELMLAEQKLLCLIQLKSFNAQEKCLLKDSPVGQASNLFDISPFSGPNGLICATD